MPGAVSGTGYAVGIVMDTGYDRKLECAEYEVAWYQQTDDKFAPWPAEEGKPVYAQWIARPIVVSVFPALDKNKRLPAFAAEAVQEQLRLLSSAAGSRGSRASAAAAAASSAGAGSGSGSSSAAPASRAATPAAKPAPPSGSSSSAKPAAARRAPAAAAAAAASASGSSRVPVAAAAAPGRSRRASTVAATTASASASAAAERLAVVAMDEDD